MDRIPEDCYADSPWLSEAKNQVLTVGARVRYHAPPFAGSLWFDGIVTKVLPNNYYECKFMEVTWTFNRTQLREIRTTL